MRGRCRSCPSSGVGPAAGQCPGAGAVYWYRTTARADLGGYLLPQVSGERYVREAVGVVTAAGTLGILRQSWREGIRQVKES
jgi:hypothetical protein